jgi:molybdate transport system substrate-binding protein
MTTRFFRVVGILGLIVGCLNWSCRSKGLQNTSLPESSLIVAAASDLTDVFQELGRQFTHEGQSQVIFSFGSTGALAHQIEQGAPFDVFVAASQSHVDMLEKQGLVLPGTQRVLCTGRIVLWQSEGSPVTVNCLEDLSLAGVKRIAIANPEHAPYGLAARQALERAGIWESVRSKLVFAENISQCRQFAETGNVEVAILALSLSRRPGGRFVLLDSSLHEPIRQTLCILRRTAHQRLSRQWVDFLLSPPGKAVLERYGFSV